VRRGVHRHLVEPRVLFGWAVANQHEVLGACRKVPCSLARMGRFGTEVLQPSVDREPAHRWAAIAKVGESGFSRLACSRISSGDPTRSGSASGLGLVGKRFRRISLGPHVPTRWRRGRWRSERGDGELEGCLQVREPAEVNALVK
jgi:hypothetical protein